MGVAKIVGSDPAEPGDPDVPVEPLAEGLGVQRRAVFACEHELDVTPRRAAPNASRSPTWSDSQSRMAVPAVGL